jgi:hypothetical protein
MKSKLLNILVFIFLIIILQQPVFSQEEHYMAKYNDVFGKYAKISMLNDYNPVIGQKSNDSGHTLGVIGSYRFSKPKKNYFFEFAIESNLYTEYVNTSYINSEGREIDPQYFTEISSFNFAINRYFESKRIFIDLQTYIGIYNKEKPIPGMTLFLQGGPDGKGGYHSIINNSPGQDNIPTGGQSILFYMEPGLKKYFIGKVFDTHDNAFLEIHANAKLGFPYEGMSANINVNSEMPLTQIISNNANIYKFTICYRHRLSLHKDGLCYIPEIGAQVSVLFLTFGYTSNYYFGKRNISMVNYIDDERMMRIYIKIKLFDMFFKD